MSSNAEEQDEEGGANVGVSRPAKKRKEVTRYHERQLGKAVRSDTNVRDKQLFLFSNESKRTSWGTPMLPRYEPHPMSMLAASSPSTNVVRDDMREDWNFEFVFHTEDASGDSVNRFDAEDEDGLEEGTCMHEKAIVSPSFFAEVTDTTTVPTSGSLMLPDAHVPKRPAEPCSVLSIPQNTMPGSSGSRGPNFIHVSRAEGVPPIPVRASMPSGTDLNVPTSNYLTLDSTYNIHQHAPGFVKNERAAFSSMFSSSMLEWNDLQEDVLMLTTGNAMRSVFEQAFADDKPLALQVQRLGPTLTVGVHSETPSSVREMRERALLSKALYRLSEGACAPESAEVKGTEKEVVDASPPLVSPPVVSTNAVALPPQRVGLSVAQHTQAHNRYSHIMRWGIDKMEVLVGVDTPILLDRRSNIEQMLKLEDTSDVMTPQEMQRDLLNCWFDATLANVPQVGIYIHNAGVVQSFKVKKVQELLGLVEGCIATAAMNFTSNVLRWLVQQCVKDGATYAVLRGYRSNYLELYELPPEHGLFNDPIYSHTPLSSTTVDADTKENRENQNRLNLNLARMCLGMARHLFQRGNIAKTPETLALLLRSFVIFLQQGEPAHAAEHVSGIVQMLPKLISRLIMQRHAVATPARGKQHSTGAEKPPSQEETPPAGDPASQRAQPEAYREALVTSARFETRLRQALEDPTISPIQRRKYACALVLCGATIGVVVARTLDAFYAEHALQLGKRPGRGRSCWTKPAKLRQTNDSGNAAEGDEFRTRKDLLQVVVEGLVRLEHLSHTIEAFVPAARSSESATPATASEATVRAPDDEDNNKGNMSQVESGAEGEEAPAASTPEAGLLMDPRTHVNAESLNRFICEIYGDVVLVAMADPTKHFTVEVLTEVARRIGSREEEKTQRQPPNEPPSPASYSTLQWLSTLTTDPLSLSFTVVRFYGKAGNQTRRVLVKMAKVYYYVGKHYLSTDRYTKALEALYRTKSLFKASTKAPEGAALEEYFSLAPMLTPVDVLRTLGDVYTRMALLKMRTGLSEARVCVSVAQPLSMGLPHHTGDEVMRFFQKAIDSYTEGGFWLAKVLVLLRYAALFVDHATLTGDPMDQVASLQVYELLAQAQQVGMKELPERSTVWRYPLEWTTLRLLTATARGQRSPALLKLVKSAVLPQWSRRLCEEAVLAAPREIQVGELEAPQGCLEAITPVEENLQLALVYAVEVEGRCAEAAVASARKAGLTTLSIRAAMRQVVAFLVAAMRRIQAEHQQQQAQPQEQQAEEPSEQTPLTIRRLELIARTWNFSSALEWVHYMALFISLRALKAVGIGGEKKLKRDATVFFDHILSFQRATEAAREKTAQDITETENVKKSYWHTRIETLLSMLEPILAW